MPSKLEESWKRGLRSGVHHRRTQAALLSPHCGRQCDGLGKGVSRPSHAQTARLCSSAPPALSPGLSRPLGLGWLAARPVRLTPESPLTTDPSLEASHQYRHWHLGHLAAALPQRRHLRSSPLLTHALLLLPQEACSCPALVSMPMTRLPCCVSWRGCASAVGLRRRGWYAPRSSMRCSGAVWRTPLSGYVIALSRPFTA